MLLAVVAVAGYCCWQLMFVGVVGGRCQQFLLLLLVVAGGCSSRCRYGCSSRLLLLTVCVASEF